MSKRWPGARALRRIRTVLREDLHTYAERDPSIASVREALFHPALPAIWGYRLAAPLHARGMRVSARLVSNIARLLTGVEIHPGARIGRRFFIDHGAGVVIGETAVIGDDVTLYQQVTLGAIGWWRDRHRPAGEARHPHLGDRVVVGAGSAVIGPVRIGDDVVVGAHALVTHDVPENSRVVGPVAEAVPRTANGSSGSVRPESIPAPVPAPGPVPPPVPAAVAVSGDTSRVAREESNVADERPKG
jgi:serine O-acetyltransferase